MRPVVDELTEKKAGRLEKSFPCRLSEHDFVSDCHATVKFVQHNFFIRYRCVEREVLLWVCGRNDWH